MGIGVGGWGDKGEKSLCFVQPDVKGWLVFFLLVSFLTVSLINGMRGLPMSLHFLTCSHRKGVLPTAFHCFSLATVLCYLPGKMLSLKQEASVDF